MSGSYREYGRDGDRDRRGEAIRNEDQDRGRDDRLDQRPEYGREHRASSREAPRRFVPVCYECGEPGHYRNQCPRLSGEGSSRFPSRNRSTSPRNYPRHPDRRPTCDEPVLKKQFEDLSSTVAMLKEFVERENARREEKERRKQEKAERRKHEEEAKAEAERLEMMKKLEAERRENEKKTKTMRLAEQKEQMKKEVISTVSVHMGGLREELKYHMDRRLEELVKLKGKAKKQSPNTGQSSDDEYESSESEVEALSEKTGHLTIGGKRRRGPEKAIGDSPPMESPAKRTLKKPGGSYARTTGRLLGCKPIPMKNSPTRKTLRKTSTKKVRKIPATIGPMGRVRYMKDNL
ncbi:hypothetical protein CBR_g4602 [Chara braunii]|uniref:CCHC-type domain-containing protein n=1 Tax=Chara braunii TaxID=69332 RepID=A0A388KI92_CHABU|nr:hypothetical protein CBR_g4602 [Chara braunii]|eukprot:GBG69771.1 hypothetical protein CBR_g4602 [Chara braunii]